jgi:hypothetical protein
MENFEFVPAFGPLCHLPQWAEREKNQILVFKHTFEEE